MNISTKKQLIFDCQGRTYAIADFVALLVIVSGGCISESYFRLLDMPVSEAIYHTEVFNRSKVLERLSYEEAERQKMVNSMAGNFEWEPNII